MPFNDVPGGNALRYYLGPAYEPFNALAQFGASMLPGADMVDMSDNSQRLMDYQGPLETLGDAGWLGLSALGMALPGRPGAARDAVEGITAYHGSPHDFDRFSMDKIGTGEGAQAYGHGLYFAENEGVAKSYREQLTASRNGNMPRTVTSYEVGGRHIPQTSPDWWAADDANTMREYGIDPNTPDGAEWLEGQLGNRYMTGRIDDTEAARAKVLDFFGKDITKDTAQGRMYEVRINANPDDFLDWDKPLSEQSDAARTGVQTAFDKYNVAWDAIPEGARYDENFRQPVLDLFKGTDAEAIDPDWIYKWPDKALPKAREVLASSPEKVAELDRLVTWLEAERRSVDHLSGGDAYKMLQAGMSNQPGITARSVPANTNAPEIEATGHLRAAGVPGIRYLDQGSRTAGDGSRNYVVFDDNLVEILRKYGMAGLLAGVTGTNALSGGQEDERY